MTEVFDSVATKEIRMSSGAGSGYVSGAIIVSGAKLLFGGTAGWETVTSS